MLKDEEINGVSFGSTGPHVAHLIFANDSVVFLQVSNANSVALNTSSLTTSGPHDKWVNLQKATAFFGKGSK